MGDWKDFAVALWWVLVVCVAFWGVGRENLRLRRELRAAESFAVITTGKYVSLTDKYVAALDRLTKTRGVLRRVWKRMRAVQYLNAEEWTAGYCEGLGDELAVRVVRQQADARSLAMCGELVRGPTPGAATVDGWPGPDLGGEGG